MEPTAKLQPRIDAFDNQVHDDKSIEVFPTLIYDMPIKLLISLAHLLQNFSNSYLIMIFSNLLRCRRKNVGIFNLRCGKDYDSSLINFWNSRYSLVIILPPIELPYILQIKNMNDILHGNIILKIAANYQRLLTCCKSRPDLEGDLPNKHSPLSDLLHNVVSPLLLWFKVF